MRDAGFGTVPVDALRDALTRHFGRRHDVWAAGGLPALRADVVRRLWGVRAGVRVALDRDRSVCIEGVNEGIDDSGALLLRLPDGMLRPVIAGDVLA